MGFFDDPLNPDTTPTVPVEGAPTWEDYGRQVVGRTHGLIGAVNAGARYISDLVGDDASSKEFEAGQRASEQLEKANYARLSPVARDRLESEITSGKFWAHPFSNLALRATGMTPDLLVSLIPAGVIANGMRATIAVAGTAGALTAGEVVKEIFNEIDNRDDEKLKKESPIYAGLRETMDEQEARKVFAHQLMGARPAITLAIGMAAGAAGPAAIAARGLKGGATSISSAISGRGSRLANAGKAAVEGGVSEAVEEGTQSGATQTALMEGGLQKEFDYKKLINNVLEGATLGSLFGGSLGGLHGADHNNQTRPGVTEGHADRDAARETDTTGLVGKLDPTIVDRDTPPAGQEYTIRRISEIPGADEVLPGPRPTPPRDDTGTIPGVDDPRGTGDPGTRAIVRKSTPDTFSPQPHQGFATDQAPPAVDPEARTSPLPPKRSGRKYPKEEKTAPAVVNQPANDIAADQALALSKDHSQARVAATPDEKVNTPAPQETPLVNPEPVPVSTPREWNTPAIEDITPAAQQRLSEIEQRKEAEREAAGQSKGRHGDAAEHRIKKVNYAISKETFGAFSELPRLEHPQKNEDQKAAIHARVKQIVDMATKAGAEIPPKRPSKDPNAPAELFWLVEANKIVKKLRDGKRPTDADYTNFLKTEILAREGDVKQLREDVRGQTTSRQGANVETIDTAAGPTAMMDRTAPIQNLAPTEKVPVKNKQGKTITIERTTEGSEVRKPQLSQEEIARILEASKAAAAKNNIVRRVAEDGSITVRGESGEDIRVHTPTSAAEILRSYTDPIGKLLQKFVGDVPTYFVSDKGLASIAGTERAPYGVYVPSSARSFILINENLLLNDHLMRETVLHEVAHHVTLAGIRSSPELRANIKALMNETAENVASRDPSLYEQFNNAFKNEEEFIAETMSNQPFQQYVLAEFDVSTALAARLGLASRPNKSILSGIIEAVRRFLGSPRDTFSALEAAFRLSEDAMGSSKVETGVNAPVYRMADGIFKDVEQRVADIVTNYNAQEGTPWLLKWRGFDNIAQISDKFFEEGKNPIRTVYERLKMAQADARKYMDEGAELVERSYNLEKKYTKDGIWDTFANLIHKETVTQVFADRPLEVQTHLGKDRSGRMPWAKAQYDELSAAYKALPEDLKALRQNLLQYYTDRQNMTALGLIKNQVLKALGIEDDALARRIHDGNTTEADAKKVGGKDIMQLILETKELAKLKGPYVPLMRRGTHVVRATYKVTPPDPKYGAKKLADNQYEFKNREDAHKYATENGLDTDVKSRYVDAKTGEYYFTDPDTAKQIKVTAQDIEGEQRFVAIVNDQHVEFVNGLKQANLLAEQYRKDPTFASVKDAEVRQREFDSGNGEASSAAMKRLATALQRRETFNSLSPSQKNDVVQALNVVSMQLQGSTRIQSRRLPRHYIQGFSKDVTRNALDYNASSSLYLGKLRHAPHIEAAMKELVDTPPPPGMGNAKRSVTNEIEDRVYSRNGFTEGSPLIDRLKIISFMDKLASPAYSIINAQQVGMVTGPVLAARHGPIAAVRAIARAYKDIGAGNIFKEGIKDTGRKIAGGKDTDYLTHILSRLPENKRNFLKEVIARGGLDVDAAGFEIARLVKSQGGITGALDTALAKAEGVVRQMPKAIETINRTVTLLAAYDLEFGKTKNHARSTQYAMDTVGRTQFDYSAINAPKYFNNPYFGAVLQFKKYGQNMYQLLGTQAALALKGDKEAAKTLGYIALTHGLMAGALGLPTEPIKYFLMAAGVFIPGVPQWNEVEDKIREVTAGAVGAGPAEMLLKGIPRLGGYGIDLSSRMGLSSLVSFGEPRSNKEADVKSYLFDLLSGSVVSLGSDWVKGVGLAANGELTEAAEKLIPLKVAADSIRAFRQATEGKKNKNTGELRSEPYSVGEAAKRAIGFTPPREAEESERFGAYKRASDRAEGDRRKLAQAWVEAKGGDRVKAMARIKDWNKGKPDEQQITVKDLRSLEKRRAKEAEKTDRGIKPTKRTQDILDRVNETYNIGGP